MLFLGEFTTLGLISCLRMTSARTYLTWKMVPSHMLKIWDFKNQNKLCNIHVHIAVCNYCTLNVQLNLPNIASSIPQKGYWPLAQMPKINQWNRGPGTNKMAGSCDYDLKRWMNSYHHHMSCSSVHSVLHMSDQNLHLLVCECWDQRGVRQKQCFMITQ